MSSSQIHKKGRHFWSRSRAPLIDAISAEPVVDDFFDNEYMATYRSYYVYIKINVGTSDKPEIKTLIIDESWNSRGPWKESKAPGRYTKWCPLELWNYVSQRYKGQECQVLKVKMHPGRGRGLWELVLVAPEAPVAQARAQTGGSDKRRSTGTGLKTSRVSMGSTFKGRSK